MKRDFELVLKILKYAEEKADGGISVRFPQFECYTDHEVNYHIDLCRQAG